MTLRLHDTLTRQLQPVQPLEPGHVRLYTCGPTVWNRAHIGNFRTFLFEDVLRRWLERRVDRVTHVMNLTDVDDRLIRNAGAHGHDLDQETAPWIAGFFEDRDTLGIRPAHHYPRATEYIEEMVSLVERLEGGGVTYRSDGSIYFRIAAFPRYGALSGIRSEGLVAGMSGRVDADDYAKEDARDFALWKAVGPDDIGWDTRIGRGRPGWHIECSAMSMKLLGESFDLHCGGVDNIFPHHENEIAQSEAATGRQFVRIWCHGEHLTMGREKMAKRLGNFLTLPDLVGAGYRPSTIRWLLITGAHYRRKLDWDEEPLQAAQEAVQRLAEFRDRVRSLGGGSGGEAIRERAEAAAAAFAAAMDDDLNVPEAAGHLFAGIRDLNRLLDAGTPSAAVRERLVGLVDEADDVLGVLPLLDRERGASLSPEDQDLYDRRAAARRRRDWAEADRLRNGLAARGIIVEDTPQGQRWKRA
ncbi:MAG TPA: cysteine--tRNA ligase [Candidatus Binatia bacterium]|nr:cysteine--tRNA ligase [Candidatus Binatia bacterium]